MGTGQPPRQAAAEGREPAQAVLCASLERGGGGGLVVIDDDSLPGEERLLAGRRAWAGRHVQPAEPADTNSAGGTGTARFKATPQPAHWRRPPQRAR